jgi:hypothetical protein
VFKGASWVAHLVGEGAESANLESEHAKFAALFGGDWPAGPVTNPERGIVEKKRVVFVLDRTWNPILTPAVDAIRNIFLSTLQDIDRVGLYSLGEDWIFPVARKGDWAQDMLEKIDNADKVSGSCALYQSMEAGLQEFEQRPPAGLHGEFLQKFLAEEAGFKPWLVVLTDTVDLDPQGETRVPHICKQLLQCKGLTLVVINSERISGWEPSNPKWSTFRANVARFVRTAERAEGGTAYHLTADTPEEITQRFAQVAAMMAAPDLSEEI